jgi:hypothetical protein
MTGKIINKVSNDNNLLPGLSIGIVFAVDKIETLLN